MSDDIKRLYAALSPEDRALVDAKIHELLMSQQQTTENEGGQTCGKGN